LSVTDNSEYIAQAIIAGTALVVSDGSLKLGFGTAAFVMEGNESRNWITGVNQVPGPIIDGASH
jgi:hypothetical protein